MRNLLIETDMTQSELANKIGYTQRAVSKWVNNQAEPTESAISNCAKIFNVSTDYLLGLEDDFGTRTASTVSSAVDVLSSEERQIVEQYRSLPEKLKKLVQEQLDVYCAPSELLPKTSKKV